MHTNKKINLTLLNNSILFSSKTLYFHI
uniref:Uncharacterized protein n=1 Tax=Arundo donax TaxID=35708 RepID=A0A0A9ARN0_ARUDO